jgi:hypothetical protein
MKSGRPGEPQQARAALLHWQECSDLAGLRDRQALEKLPADERKAFTQLWAEVAELSVELARQALPQDIPERAGILARTGAILLDRQQWAEAEPLLRECLALREKAQPDAWSTFNTKSALGGALLSQKKYAEAEPLLLAGYQGMKKRAATIPLAAKVRLPEAALRLVQLYQAQGRKAEVARWQKEREALQTPPQKPETKP